MNLKNGSKHCRTPRYIETILMISVLMPTGTLPAHPSKPGFSLKHGGFRAMCPHAVLDVWDQPGGKKMGGQELSTNKQIDVDHCTLHGKSDMSSRKLSGSNSLLVLGTYQQSWGPPSTAQWDLMCWTMTSSRTGSPTSWIWPISLDSRFSAHLVEPTNSIVVVIFLSGRNLTFHCGLWSSWLILYVPWKLLPGTAKACNTCFAPLRRRWLCLSLWDKV